MSGAGRLAAALALGLWLLAPAGAAAEWSGVVFADRNGDGDAQDLVVHYLPDGSTTPVNLGLTLAPTFQGAMSSTHGWIPVHEPSAGADLNGDGVDDSRRLVFGGPAERVDSVSGSLEGAQENHPCH